MDAITKEFVSALKSHQDDHQTPDIMPELARLNLECMFKINIIISILNTNCFYLIVVCYLAFDVRMKSFEPQERQRNSVTSRLIEAAEITNSCILPLDQGMQLWRHFETPTYRKLRIAQEFMER